MDSALDTALPSAKRDGSPEPDALKRLSSADLMAGAREVIIDHDGREYRLRITQLGKLILTR